MLSEDEMNNLIFLPGFSTAEMVLGYLRPRRRHGCRPQEYPGTRRPHLAEVGARPGHDAFNWRLPLTLAVMDGMVIKVGHADLRDAAVGDHRVPAAAAVSDMQQPGGHPRHACSCAAISCRSFMLGDLLDINSPAASEPSERVVIITDAGEGSALRPGGRRTLWPSAGGDQEHRGELRLRSGYRRRHDLGNGRVAFILDVEKLSEMAANSPLGAAIYNESGVARFELTFVNMVRLHNGRGPIRSNENAERSSVSRFSSSMTRIACGR